MFHNLNHFYPRALNIWTLNFFLQDNTALYFSLFSRSLKHKVPINVGEKIKVQDKNFSQYNMKERNIRQSNDVLVSVTWGGHSFKIELWVWLWGSHALRARHSRYWQSHFPGRISRLKIWSCVAQLNFKYHLYLQVWLVMYQSAPTLYTYDAARYQNIKLWSLSLFV